MNQGTGPYIPLVFSDTDRVLECYEKPIERIKNALDLCREELEHFELSGCNSIPLGEHDITTLQSRVDRVSDFRKTVSQN